MNGDGRAALPPGVISTMNRYRQPERRRTGLQVVGRILLTILAAVVMVIAALAGGAYLFFHESVAAVRAHSKDVKLAQTYLHAPPPGKPAIALIIGYDRRYGEGGYGRSDTMMLVRADPETKSISMLSFPRDLKVVVRCPGREWVDKLNAAYANCGSKGAVLTIKALTGLSINYLIKVNFRGFRQIVNQLGGVWIDVDHWYFNNNAGLSPGYTYDTINLKPGYQRLNGAQALDYVRFRHTDNDLLRNARQQAFVKAIKGEIHDSIQPWNIPKIINRITSNVEIGRGGGAELSEKEVLRYALFAYSMPSGHFFQTKLSNLTEDFGATFYLTVPESSIQASVRDFVNPDVEAPEKAEEVALGRRRGKKKAIRPRAVSVSVLNGNRVPGSAALARGLLKDRGFRTIEPANPLAANAPSETWHTTVYYDPAKKKAKAGAGLVADAFGDANVVRGIPLTLTKLADGAMTVVVVGNTFHGRLAPAPIDKTPKKQPPQVRVDASATLGMLRKRQRRVPFPLLVPTRVEQWSESPTQGSHAMPIRVHRLGGDHVGVRLVFQMSDGIDFWGIEETDWNDAPILDQPNATRYIKGRRYDLYFSGPDLHMVVRRTDKASYWVINSLDDAMSNETMLAIAKGLRPLVKPHKPKSGRKGKR